ncbi:hypothetical protein Tco_0977720 [Tanacetum coccineum]|uniref:Uncharacterized protein n=1 Tax=Tanacetum coccineum TaxID=301880 RepID=A0ABQ5ELC0_9ASTR
MENMYVICRNEGFLDLNIHHVGEYYQNGFGYNFPSFMSCSKFLRDCDVVYLYVLGAHMAYKKLQVALENSCSLEKENQQALKFREVDHVYESNDGANLDDFEILQTKLNNMDEQAFDNELGTKLSKLDRFLISEDVTIRLPDVRITALDRLWSDHNHILLHIDKTDFWSTSVQIWIRYASDYVHASSSSKIIEKINKFASMDIIQKSHVKWDIEGDENSKFFHGLINQKRRNQMINGIMVEGNWNPEPLFVTRRLPLRKLRSRLGLWNVVKAAGPDGYSLRLLENAEDLMKVLSAWSSNAGCMAGDVPFILTWSSPVVPFMKSIASWKTLVIVFSYEAFLLECFIFCRLGVSDSYYKSM